MCLRSSVSRLFRPRCGMLEIFVLKEGTAEPALNFDIVWFLLFKRSISFLIVHQ